MEVFLPGDIIMALVSFDYLYVQTWIKTFLYLVHSVINSSYCQLNSWQSDSDLVINKAGQENSLSQIGMFMYMY